MAEDQLRIRRVRSATLRVVLGVVLVAGAWLVLPFAVYHLAIGPVALVPGIEAVGGAMLLAGGVIAVLSGLRGRRRAETMHAPVTESGKANPAFDEDRRPLPTGGVPLGWIGNVPGS
jgi:hypothetical protein